MILICSFLTLVSQLFAGLGSENPLGRRGAASAIASIAVAEISVGEWNELIPTLGNAVKQGNHTAQEGALITIGLICEDVVRRLRFSVLH